MIDEVPLSEPLSSIGCLERASIPSLGGARRPRATWSSIKVGTSFRAGSALSRDLGLRTLNDAMNINVFAEIPPLVL